MKPPFFPGIDKMIKDAAIRSLEKESRPILEEVLVNYIEIKMFFIFKH